ncbi:hypothetical protein N0V83_000761 [Neocucurbitaria cava]|uniref:Uncharacterized protein n=1 Tax=Neocucurbitaria cava TaxID=798079 RepID=A0A9W9CRH6_9PLEO|nr:hypothetical protein N0V83_000761 [Neocucurbitaria cava]
MTKDEEYEAAIEKGSRLLRMMLVGDHEAGQLLDPPQASAQSRFNTVANLQAYGYEEQQDIGFFRGKSIRKALQALGVDDQIAGVDDQAACEGGKNIVILHIHTETKTIGGQEYAATHARFSQVCNHAEGVLIAHDNRTAPHMGPFQDKVITKIPPLVHWSDIAFLQHIASNPNPTIPPATLKYIVRLTIQNVPTYTILSKILMKHGLTQWDTWPGITFDIDSEEGRAILGTPNGSGTAWLLIQHKKQLGDRKIEKVTLFYAGNKEDIYRWPSLLFWVG